MRKLFSYVVVFFVAVGYTRCSEDRDKESEKLVKAVKNAVYSGIYDVSDDLVRTLDHQKHNILHKIVAKGSGIEGRGLTNSQVDNQARKRLLTYAAELLKDDARIGILLLNKGTKKCDHSPLFFAVHYFPELAKLFLDKGADPNEVFFDVVTYVYTHYFMHSPIIEGIKVLISSGKLDYSHTDKNGGTVLHNAVRADHGRAKKDGRLLLEEFFKVPELRQLINAKDFEGNTPLHLARWEESFQPLLARPEIDVTIKNNKGETPLMYFLNHENNFEYYDRPRNFILFISDEKIDPRGTFLYHNLDQEPVETSYLFATLHRYRNSDYDAAHARTYNEVSDGMAENLSKLDDMLPQVAKALVKKGVDLKGKYYYPEKIDGKLVKISLEDLLERDILSQKNVSARVNKNGAIVRGYDPNKALDAIREALGLPRLHRGFVDALRSGIKSVKNFFTRLVR